MNVENKTTENLPICYAIPGLGVTGEVFTRLSGLMNLRIIDWILPHPKESLTLYADRMSQLIPPDAEVLIGYSFGGIVAQEIQKKRPHLSLVLINTLIDKKEKPVWLKMMKGVPLYRLTRGSWRIRLLPIYGKRYGLKTREDIAVLQKMFSETPDQLRIWSIKALISWTGFSPMKGSYLRLHGRKDKVFPLDKKAESVTWISAGRHFMIWQHAEVVSQEINSWILQNRS